MARNKSKPGAPLADKLALHSKDSPCGCRLWMGGKDRKGYGKIQHAGKIHGSHRLAWVERHGPIPDGMWVLHKCDVPACINPDHLFLGDSHTNVADMVAKRRQCIGARNGMAKLTWEKVMQIRADGRLAPVIATEHGISQTYIYEIINWRAWKFPPSADAA